MFVVKRVLIKCALLFSLFIPKFCVQVYAVKNVHKTYYHRKLERQNSTALGHNNWDRKTKRTNGKRNTKKEKMKVILKNRFRNKSDSQLKKFVCKYWPYFPLVPLVPFGIYLTCKLAKNDICDCNEFTPKQEGKYWCWLACWVGLFNKLNVPTPGGKKITQEWLFEQIFEEKPPKSYSMRDQGSQSVCWDSLLNVQFTNGLSQDISYKYADVNCLVYPNNFEITVQNMEKIILDFYEKTGQRSFSTNLDKPYLKNIGHIVNIDKIFDQDGNKWIIYEDPLKGRRYKRSLRRWCENHIKFRKYKDYTIGSKDIFVNFSMLSLAKPDCKLYDYTVFRATNQNDKNSIMMEERFLSE